MSIVRPTELSSTFISENFNLQELATRLGVAQKILTDSMLASVKTSSVCTVSSSSVLDFSSVEDRHLKSLREPGSLQFKAGAEKHFIQEGREALAGFDQYRQQVAEIFWPRIEAGCHILIDSTIVPAVHAAQKLQQTDPITIISGKGVTHIPKDSRLVIFPQWNVSRVAVGGEEHDINFHGSLDYAVVVVDRATYVQIQRRASPLPPRNNASLLTIVEVKSPITMESGRSQIEAQCLALLKDTGRAFSPGVLTNGVTWVFYVASANENGAIVYEGPTLCTDDKDEDALVVGILKELIRSPGTMPSCFEPSVE
ncbi:hypothetical protein B0H11DRAFT_2236811 [Mycena galericulata]|nr:hypothetical protein B0H11DRAFT_2236811 [Mycena galericulata]